MKSLYLRIYLTVVAALALFALGSTWLFQQEVQRERTRQEAQVGERVAAWAELIQRSLPPADAPAADQASALREWSQRLRLAIALDSADGVRIGASDAYLRRTADADAPRGLPVRAKDLPEPRLRLVGRATRPSDAEIAANPRARSATLRVAERTQA